MKYRIIIILICSAVFIHTASSAKKSDDKQRLDNAITKALTKRCVSKTGSAVRVISLPDGNVLFDKNSSKPIVPASVQKLTTTAAALHYLGPDYRFKTGIYHTGVRDGAVIKGDLYIKGGGDPKLVPEQVWLIAQQLKRMGIKKVEGALVADNSFFDKHKIAPSWSKAPTQRAYDARLGALSVNFNTIAVSVYPGATAGAPVIVGLMPDIGYIQTINGTATISRGKNSVRVWRETKESGIYVFLKGKLRKSSEGSTFHLNVEDPTRFAGETFFSYFKRAGIDIKGKIRIGETPENAQLIYEHESEPLSIILRGLNRYSNNFMAEQIAKTIAAEKGTAPGSHNIAMKLIHQFLEASGVATAGVELVDASGLSRQNRMTAVAITDLLKSMRNRFDIGPDFIASLGIMGVDGSVKKRLRSAPPGIPARAKTGSLSKISSLAGYVEGKEGGLYAFAIFLNDNGCYYKDADKVEDEIVSAIYKYRTDH